VEGFYLQHILGYSIGHSDFGIGGRLSTLKTKGLNLVTARLVLIHLSKTA
jgi:hypothetical protein